MIKSVATRQPTNLVIIRDNKIVANISVPMMDGGIDTDGFKHIETVTDPMSMSITVKVEV